MKKIIAVILTLMLVLPIGVSAKDTKYSTYKTMNFKETLEAEDLELENEDYEETDDQATIYMFRGQGCGYCRKFLTFLSSISEEYGKYFKLVSFEVWQDQDNSELMQQVGESLGEEIGGVPFIIIGDKTFPGYAETYDEQIKDAIKELYEQDPKDREDLFDNLGNASKKKSEKEKKEEKDANVAGVIAIVVIAGVAALAVISRRKAIRV